VTARRAAAVSAMAVGGAGRWSQPPPRFEPIREKRAAV
jgi:hypothetical protein